jgi:hypothetical protein
MSTVKERAKQLIEQLPDEAVTELLEDLEDALELKKAIAEEGDRPGVPLEKLIEQLKIEGKL